MFNYFSIYLKDDFKFKPNKVIFIYILKVVKTSIGSEICFFKFINEDKLITSGTNNNLILFNLNNSTIEQIFQIENSCNNSNYFFDISKDFKYLSCGLPNGYILVWEINSEKKGGGIVVPKKYYNHTCRVNRVKFSNKFPILLSADSNLNIWYPL